MSSGLRRENNRRSRFPVYIQISDAMRTRVTSRKLAPDSVLTPPEQTCEEEPGITRMMLRQASAVRTGEALLECHPGGGTFVQPSHIERILGQMVGFSEEMFASGNTQVYCLEPLRLADAITMAMVR